MSGHSKWSTIKRQKGATDAKKGQLFTKLSYAITIAAKQGGLDPSTNFKLRLAIDKARAANMPKDSIERAIQKASGGEKSEMDELIYEGFGPGGTAVVVQTITDNKQRTVSEVKNLFEKNGGNMGSQGSVAYLFEKLGEITVLKGGKNADELLEMGLDAGVSDMDEDELKVYYYTNFADLFKVKQVLEEKGIAVEEAELIYKPKTTIEVDEVTGEKVMNLVEKLEELDDVQKVYTNLA